AWRHAARGFLQRGTATASSSPRPRGWRPQIMLVGCRARAMLHRKRTGTSDARTMGLPRAAVRRYPCAAVRAFAPCRGGHGRPQAATTMLGGHDVASAAALRRLPLMRTLSVAACYARDGYLLATAQAVLLEAYGGLP
ncbi:unnamed protein product, partial [Effrenium voratum]